MKKAVSSCATSTAVACKQGDPRCFAHSAFQDHWSPFRLIFRMMNRRGELKRLVQWAERKRLAGPRRSYQVQLDDAERLLNQYTLRSPGAAKWARRTYQLAQWIVPAPRFPARGSAAAYCRRNRTKQPYSIARRCPVREMRSQDFPTRTAWLARRQPDQERSYARDKNTIRH